MKAADAFLAFKDLQDATLATDEQLKAMLAYGCKSAGPVNYEDALSEMLLRLFRAVTGVKWIRGWEQGARPDEQYCTLWLFGMRAIGAPAIAYDYVYNAETNVVLDDLCEVVSQQFEIQFQLDAYKDSGAATRGQDGGASTGPQYSAVDVLSRLLVALSHPRNRAALSESCVILAPKAFGAIRNYAKPLVQNSFESRAGVDFYIRVNMISSMRSPTFGDIDWGFICPTDAELNPDPPPIVVC